MVKMRQARIGSVLVALAVMLGVLSSCSRDPNVRKQKYLASGNRYYGKKQYHEAVIQYQNALQADPRFVDAHYQLAQCYLNLAMVMPAFRELSRTIELDPKNWKAHIDHGSLLILGKDKDRHDALDEAQLVVSEQPNNTDAHVLLANVLAVLGKPDKALKEMQKAIQLDSTKPQLYLNLAAKQTRAKQFEAAEESYKKAIQLDPKSAPSVMLLCRFYGQQHRWPE